MGQGSYRVYKPTEEKKDYLKHYLLSLTKGILTLGRDTGLQATESPITSGDSE